MKYLKLSYAYITILLEVVKLVPVLAVLVVLASTLGVNLVFGEAQEENPILVIHKVISHSTFTWSDQVDITITISNVGSKAANNIHIIDYIPVGFKVESKEGLTTEADKVMASTDEIKPEGEYQISYNLSAQGGINSKEAVVLILPQAEVRYSDESGNETSRKSNQITATVKSAVLSSGWEIGQITTIFIVIAFGFGSLGTAIHNTSIPSKKSTEQSTSTQKKPTGTSSQTKTISPIGTPAHVSSTTKPKQQETTTPSQQQETTTTSQEQETTKTSDKIKYSPLIGGAAGVFVLASFEGLSVLFSDGALQITEQNMIVLIATCLAGGFAPMEIVFV